MNRLQEKLFELMCEFDEICRNNNIKYYLCAGTALGALRHEGFIPWDDDVDINMSRNEYKKLEAIIDTELKEGRELVSKERYPEYRSPIPRYVRLDSSMFMRNHLSDGAPHGVFLDILILDPVPQSKEALLRWRKKHYIYCELLEPQYVIAARKNNWKDIDFNMLREYVDRCESEGKEKVLKELENELFTIEENEATYYCMRFATVWVGMSRIEWYGNPREVMFEGQLFYVPRKAEMELALYYGHNWKYIPKERKTHLTLKLIDIHSGNCEREYFNIISKKQFETAVFEDNKALLEECELNIKTFYDKYEPYIHYIRHRIDKDINEFGEEKLRNNPKLGYSVFKNYLDVQFMREFASNGKYISLNCAQTELLVHILFRMNDVGRINALLNLRINSGETLSEDMQRLKKFAYDMIRLSNLRNLKAYSYAKKIIDIYETIYPENILIVRGKAEIDLRYANTKEEYIKISKYISKMLKIHTSDGELIKYLGDALAACGDKKGANDMYMRAAKITDNGLILLELSKKGIVAAEEKIHQI